MEGQAGDRAEVANASALDTTQINGQSLVFDLKIHVCSIRFVVCTWNVTSLRVHRGQQITLAGGIEFGHVWMVTKGERERIRTDFPVKLSLV